MHKIMHIMHKITAGYVKYTYMLSVNTTTMGYKTPAKLKHHGL